MVRPASGDAIDDDRSARPEATQQQRLGERVLDHVLDDAAQRARAVVHVVAQLDDVVLGLVGDDEVDLLGPQLLAHPGEQQVDDLADLLDGERAEDHEASRRG